MFQLLKKNILDLQQYEKIRRHITQVFHAGKGIFLIDIQVPDSVLSA